MTRGFFYDNYFKLIAFTSYRSLLLHRNFLLTLLPGLVLAAIMIGIDQIFGSGAYGAVALIPAVIANAGQSVALIRAPHVGGVSVLFLILAVLNQVLWLAWSILVADLGTMIAAGTTGTIALFNLIWYTARQLGVPPIWPTTASPERELSRPG